jgi:peptidyl-prolyl cis-trans isomerase C
MTRVEPNQSSNAAMLLRRLCGEPLVQFLVLGGLIFALNGYVAADRQAYRIEVSQSDLARLRAQAFKQWGKEPDAVQLSGMLQDYIREEVLYRQALATGMDQDDVIVRRRLAQKMEFLAQADVREPSAEEILAFYQQHPERYGAPAEVAFKQVYLSQELRGAALAADAAQALAQLRGGQAVQGDNLLLPGEFAAQSQPLVARDFGDDFAAALFALPVGQWSGPLRSPYGLHLVWVSQQAGERLQSFAAVRDKVRADLANQRLTEARDGAYQQLLSRYQVSVAEPALLSSSPQVSAR